MLVNKSRFEKEIERLGIAGLLHGIKSLNQPNSEPLEWTNDSHESRAFSPRSFAIIEPWLFAQAGINPEKVANPLLLYVAEAQAGRHLSPHPLIDPDHLLQQLAPEEHLEGYSLLYSYLQLTAERKQQVSPSPWFEPQIYLHYNNDLSSSERSDPFLHYLLLGAQQGRPACSRFDAFKWREQHPKLLHPAPVVDFLVRRHRQPELRPTRPNLPGGITLLTRDGELGGWVQDPDAEAPPQVFVWWDKTCIAKARLLTGDAFASQAGINRANFIAALPTYLAHDIVQAARNSTLCLQLFTQEGEEIGTPKGWKPNKHGKQVLHQWLHELETPNPPNGLNTGRTTFSPGHSDAIKELCELHQRLRTHEERLRRRLAPGTERRSSHPI